MQQVVMCIISQTQQSVSIKSNSFDIIDGVPSGYTSYSTVIMIKVFRKCGYKVN